VKSFTRVSQMEKKTFVPGTGTKIIPKPLVQRLESGGKFADWARTNTHIAPNASKTAGRIHDLVAQNSMGWSEGFLVAQPTRWRHAKSAETPLNSAEVSRMVAQWSLKA
jgi:hypothetical protein